MSAADVGKNIEDAAKDMSDKEVDKYTKLTKEDIDELRELLNMKKENVMPDVKPNDGEMVYCGLLLRFKLINHFTL